MLNHRSGMLGLAGAGFSPSTTSDRNRGRVRWWRSEVFIHRYRTLEFAYLAVLGHTDGDFTAGIRRKRCGGAAGRVGWPSGARYIALDQDRNLGPGHGARRIYKSDDSPIAVLVVPTKMKNWPSPAVPEVNNWADAERESYDSPPACRVVRFTLRRLRALTVGPDLVGHVHQRVAMPLVGATRARLRERASTPATPVTVNGETEDVVGAGLVVLQPVQRATSTRARICRGTRVVRSGAAPPLSGRRRPDLFLGDFTR